MKTNHYLCIGLLACLTGATKMANAQEDNRVITTGASFLLLSPDARTAGVAGAATGLSTDPNSMYVNAAKLPFGEIMGISASFTPWMRELTRDTQLGYLSAYRQLNSRETIGASVKYLSLGSINFRNELGELLQKYQASEFTIDGSYARLFGDNFAMSITGRYYHSDLGAGVFNGLELKASSAFAADVAIYSNNVQENGKGIRWGLSINNIGSKLRYSDNQSSFLPTTFRAGAGYTFFNTPDNRLTLLMDVSKLLVPTPPTYKMDELGNYTAEIEKGRDPDRSVASALFSSFYDAPGGFKEELSEFTIAGGWEYAYYERFLLRAGYFYEDSEKGNRTHFAAGAGFVVNPLRIDISYIFPTGDRFVMKNTMNLTLTFSPGSKN